MNTYNSYKKLDEDTYVIYMYDKKGKQYDVYVDAYGFNKIKDFQYAWIPVNRQKRIWYAKTTEYISGSKSGKGFYMHQMILDTYLKNVIVDHVDRNGLNNRLSNLRIVEKRANTTNRKCKNNNNTTGYRNVLYIKRNTKHPYQVRLQINGKNTKLGNFSNVDEAGAFAEEMRQKYYGEYAGAN